MEQSKRALPAIFAVCLALLAAIGAGRYWADRASPAYPAATPATAAQAWRAGLAQTARVSAPDPQEKLAAAVAQNPDVAAWLTLPGTDIDAPVLQAADNRQYLRRSLAGAYDEWGSLFADYECTLSSPEAFSRVTVVYGHSWQDDPDGAGFSQVKRYGEQAFALQNPVVYFTMPGESAPRAWQVFAAGPVPKTLGYLNPAPPDNDFSALVQALLAASLQPFAAEPPAAGDKILILSTCTTNADMRFVVAAKRVEDPAA